MVSEKIAINTKVTFQYGGAAYLALTYAKMKNKRFSSAQLAKCLAGKFNSVDGATKALKVLEKNACVTRLSVSDWIVTQKGIDVVLQFGKSRKEATYTRGMG